MNTRDLIGSIQQIIEHDVGNRGIETLCERDQLLYTAQHLSHKATRSVAIITGFFIPPTETDGPLGAFAIVKALLHMGKRVVLVTDENNRPTLERMLQYWQWADKVPLCAFPTPMGKNNNNNNEPGDSVEKQLQNSEFELSESDLQEARHLALDILQQHNIDHILAIERSGPNEHNRVYSMRARDLTSYTGRTEALFDVLDEYCQLSGKSREHQVRTSGIGDGGNELGMGKKREMIAKNINNGPIIACRVATDYLITTGVSNWGGYALAAALCILSSKNNVVADFVPTVDQDRDLLRFMTAECGAIDGILGQAVLSVDGFSYDPVHADVLNRITAIATVGQHTA